MTELKRDRYGRYLLPDPETGTWRPWTRATTWAASASDTYSLTKWKMRMVAKGVATRRDLYGLAASLPLEDKKAFDALTDDAIDAAGGGEAANLGTTLHNFTADLDRGNHPDIPAPWDRDVAAYRSTLYALNVRAYPRYVERTVIVPEFGVAGTFDRIVEFEDQLYIADVKTGADLSYAWGEIAVQLALYANAEAMWNQDDGTYEPYPVVDRGRAIVIHLPEGQAKCDLYWVDILAGWIAAQMCGEVRAWRTRKDLAVPFDRLEEQLKASVEQASGAARGAAGAESLPAGVAGDALPPPALVVSQDGDAERTDGSAAPEKSGTGGDTASASDSPVPDTAKETVRG